MKKNLFLVGMLILQASVFIASDSQGSVSSRDSEVCLGSDTSERVGASHFNGWMIDSEVCLGSDTSERVGASHFNGWMIRHEDPKQHRYSGACVGAIIRSCAVATTDIFDFDKNTQEYTRARRKGVFETGGALPDVSLDDVSMPFPPVKRGSVSVKPEPVAAEMPAPVQQVQQVVASRWCCSCFGR